MLPSVFCFIVVVGRGCASVERKPRVRSLSVMGLINKIQIIGWMIIDRKGLLYRGKFCPIVIWSTTDPIRTFPGVSRLSKYSVSYQGWTKRTRDSSPGK